MEGIFILVGKYAALVGVVVWLIAYVGMSLLKKEN